MDKDVAEQFRELLSTPCRAVIVTHKNPDGDALGSSLGLYGLLRKKGFQVQVITPNDYPAFLKWMPYQKDVIRYDWTPEKADRLVEEARVIFNLDFNDLSRIDALGDRVRISPAVKVMIDHHREPTDFCRLVYSDTSIGSTSQMVFHLAEALGWENRIDKEIASCLYAGILTDTGSFRFPSTTALTHRVVAFLMEAGAEASVIYEKIFDSFTESRFRLMGTALSNMVVMHPQKSVYMTLTQDELDRGGFRKGDTEGFVNIGLSVEGVNLSAIFIENRREGIIKVSLRSKGRFSVNEMGRRYFNGGGHINAAGGQLPFTDMERAVELFRRAVDENQEEIVRSYE